MLDAYPHLGSRPWLFSAASDYVNLRKPWAVMFAKGCYYSTECSAGLGVVVTGVLVLGLFATEVGLALFRRSRRSWNIGYDAAVWLFEEANFDGTQ
jgi:hypothetical protein